MHVLATHTEIDFVARPVSLIDEADALPSFVGRCLLHTRLLKHGRGGKLLCVSTDRLHPSYIKEISPILAALLRLKQRFLCFRFGQPMAVQVDGAGMVLAPLTVEPVPLDRIAEGIEVAEEAVRQDHLPHIVAGLGPAGDDFRSLDDDVFPVGCPVGNALGIGCAATWWIDPLAVNACMHRNRIARLRLVSRGLNRQQRF